jgi:hypothetical protein
LLVGESHTLTEVSDKDIYQAVMDAWEAHKNLEINGGNNVDEEVPLEPNQILLRILYITVSELIFDYFSGTLFAFF